MYKCWDKYLLSADYRRQVNTQERLILFAIVYLHLWKINNNNNQQTVYEVQSETGRACLYHLQRMRRSRTQNQGQVPQRVKEAGGPRKNHRWLKAAGLKAETESFIIAAQDQSLPTRWYQHNILKKPDVDPTCRLCGRFDETIDHLVSSYPTPQQGSCIDVLEDLQTVWLWGEGTMERAWTQDCHREG